ncbi:MAG: hypothetical protein HGJ94_18390 [Desulfosarcina sp.]|nr:hypothetical protein [Desulfosarcina sp.]
MDQALLPLLGGASQVGDAGRNQDAIPLASVVNQLSNTDNIEPATVHRVRIYALKDGGLDPESPRPLSNAVPRDRNPWPVEELEIVLFIDQGRGTG